MNDIKQNYQQEKAWGISSSIDLYDCNYDLITQPKPIKKFVFTLTDFLQVKRYGQCQLIKFGQQKGVYGYSMIQLIETSLISGHFANESRVAYLDIFSCKYYNPNKAAEFSQKFFQARNHRLTVTLRK